MRDVRSIRELALGNEFSDHVVERKNYLYLAHSELRLGKLPGHLAGISRTRRGDQMLWEKGASLRRD